jgi:hypothetical protein
MTGATLEQIYQGVTDRLSQRLHKVAQHGSSPAINLHKAFRTQ